MRFAVELIMLAVLLVCAWSGYKKGLVMGVGTIIAIVISLYMGNLLSETFSPQAAPVLKPFISGYMDGTEGVVGDKLDELLGSSGDAKLSVEDVLKNKKTCPEESIYQLGTMDEHASVEMLVTIFDKFKKEFDEL